MRMFRREARQRQAPGSAADRVREKYASFRKLLAYNNESLELMAALQDDLQYVPPSGAVLGGRIESIFHRIEAVVVSLERLTGISQQVLLTALQAQRHEIEGCSVTRSGQPPPRLRAWL